MTAETICNGVIIGNDLSATDGRQSCVLGPDGSVQYELDDVGFDYIDQVLDQFNVHYFASQTSRRNIPAHGRFILVANYPVSYLDCLALMRFISEIRSDVKLVSMDLLTSVPQLAKQVITVGKGSVTTQRRCIAEILNALNQEQGVIVFPAIKQAGLGKKRKRDKKWHHRFVTLALYSGSPILPVHIRHRPKRRPVFTATMPKVMRIEQQLSLDFSVGELISYEVLKACPFNVRKRSQLIRRHLYHIAKGRRGIFATEKSIIHPQSPLALREELQDASLLGETADGHKIYLFEYCSESAVMREIGRLREFTFRCIGEGTGRHKDLDRFDRYYKHLVLWNEDRLEIVGSYRMAVAEEVVQQYGLSGLYCQDLFELAGGFEQYLPRALELGRSFVQPKYWGKRSLDYLWYGIGAYIRHNGRIRYLYGPVSISNSYPELAKNALVSFYRKYFGAIPKCAEARRPYNVRSSHIDSMLKKDDYQTGFRRLKEYLSFLDVKVPTLYKQYTELCEPGGVVFEDFSVDPEFANCIDGLVRVDLALLKQKKRERYITDG